VGNDDISAVKISQDQGKSWRDVEVPESLGCVHMNITALKNGHLVALFRSRWADNIYISQSLDHGESWSVPEPTDLPNNNSSIQVTTLASGELALVFNHMSAAGALERRASLYDEIDDGDGRKEPEVTTGRAAFWGAPRAPMLEKLNREFSYPSIKQGADGALHIAYTYFRQAIKYVRVSPEWVKESQQ